MLLFSGGLFMLKKLKVLIVGLLLLIVSIGAFANGNGETTAQGSDETVIEFWAYDPDISQKGLLDAVAEFESQTGYNVNLSFIPKNDYNTKMNSAIAAGKTPDIGYLDQPLVPRYAVDDVIFNLEEMANGDNGIDRSKYYQGALSTNIVNGNLYGLPLNQTCVALFYNKDLVPVAPVTWDDWLVTAATVYKPGEIAAMEVPNGDGWGAWLYPAFVSSAGGSMVSDDESTVAFDQEPAVDALNLWIELNEFSDPEVKDSANAFNRGLIATKISGPWELGNLDSNFPNLNYGVALVPKQDADDQHASNIGGENIVIYKTTKNVEAAWALVKFLTYTPEYSLLMAQSTGNFPGLLEAGQDESYQDENMSVFMKQMETAKARPRISSWLKINDEVIAKALAQALLGELPADEALSLAAKKANMIISRD